MIEPERETCTGADPSTPLFRVHRRQFVIGPRAFAAAPGWRSMALGDQMVLSCDPELRLDTCKDRDGISWYLLGAVVDARPDSLGPLAEVAKRRGVDVQELYQTWAGRWVLVGDGRLHPDAAAMLGCYYGRNSDGELWVSSSPTLIRQVLGLGHAEDPDGVDAGWRPAPSARASGATKGFSFYPPPWSGIPGVHRLLPSQILDLCAGKPEPRPLVQDLRGRMNDAEIIEALGTAVRTAIRRFAALNAPHEPTLMLSGGRDSRLLLSLAVSAGLRLRTFTRLHRRATLADQILPPRLAKSAGYAHVSHRQVRELPGRRQAVLDHAGYNLSWIAVEELLGGGMDPLTGIALGGFCAELGRVRHGPDVPLSEATGQMIAKHFNEDRSPDIINALDLWLQWHRAHPSPLLELVDYHQLEFRIAGRRAAKEQICDMFPAERVGPLNCTYVFTLIANLSPRLRRDGSWLQELIGATAPDLLNEPANPPDEYFGIVRGKMLNRRFHRSTAKSMVDRLLGHARASSPHDR